MQAHQCNARPVRSVALAPALQYMANFEYIKILQACVLAFVTLCSLAYLLFFAKPVSLSRAVQPGDRCVHFVAVTVVNLCFALLQSTNIILQGHLSTVAPLPTRAHVN